MAARRAAQGLTPARRTRPGWNRAQLTPAQGRSLPINLIELGGREPSVRLQAQSTDAILPFNPAAPCTCQARRGRYPAFFKRAITSLARIMAAMANNPQNTTPARVIDQAEDAEAA